MVMIPALQVKMKPLLTLSPCPTLQQVKMKPLLTLSPCPTLTPSSPCLTTTSLRTEELEEKPLQQDCVVDDEPLPHDDRIADSDLEDSLSENAPTERLSQYAEKAEEEILSSEAESEGEKVEWRDSQVSSGWLGQAYNYYNRIEKEEQKEESLLGTLAEIRTDLEAAAGATFQEDDVMWKVGFLEHLQFWVRRRKAKSAVTATEEPAAEVPKKRSLNKALSMMDLEETIEDNWEGGRAPPCKRPKNVEQVLASLGSPDIVGDQTAKKMTALKAKDKGAGDVMDGSGDVLDKFRGYSLDQLGVPHGARPRANQVYMGQHGYTLRSPQGGAIEVLLKQRAYVVKRLDDSVASGPDDKSGLGQVTWSKYGGASKAWAVAASRAGFNVNP
eukprot:s488_g18.t1